MTTIYHLSYIFISDDIVIQVKDWIQSDCISENVDPNESKDSSEDEDSGPSPAKGYMTDDIRTTSAVDKPSTSNDTVTETFSYHIIGI